MIITVTWMDGKQETYSAARLDYADAHLIVFTAAGPEPGPEEIRYSIPLCNVRVLRTEQP